MWINGNFVWKNSQNPTFAIDSPLRVRELEKKKTRICSIHTDNIAHYLEEITNINLNFIYKTYFTQANDRVEGKKLKTINVLLDTCSISYIRKSVNWFKTQRRVSRGFRVTQGVRHTRGYILNLTVQSVPGKSPKKHRGKQIENNFQS